MTAPTIQVKRGALSNLPGLKIGEPAFTTDSFDFYVGIDSTTNNNKFVGSHRYWKKETASAGSGVNLVESTGGVDFITLAAPASVGAAVTYYFPATQGINGTILTNDGSGNLSWGGGLNNTTFTGITTVGTLKLSGTAGVGITGISSSTTLAENSNDYLPTQAAVKAYVDAVDVTLGLNADTGGPSTVSTSQTLTISGTANEVETSVAGQTVTVGLPNTVIVGTALSAPTVQTTNIQATDGTTSITITGGTGAIGFANSVIISGDLYVLGNTTEVNTSALKIEDTLIDLGLVNSAGSLIPPFSDLNLDLGILFNWYNGSAKKASVYWDDSLQRVGIASDVTESTGVLTANAYAAVQIKELWVTDCAGTSQVISCTSSQRFLENITVDCGTF